jgi:hypothetical protein
MGQTRSHRVLSFANDAMSNVERLGETVSARETSSHDADPARIGGRSTPHWALILVVTKLGCGAKRRNVL